MYRLIPRVDKVIGKTKRVSVQLGHSVQRFFAIYGFYLFSPSLPKPGNSSSSMAPLMYDIILLYSVAQGKRCLTTKNQLTNIYFLNLIFLKFEVKYVLTFIRRFPATSSTESLQPFAVMLFYVPRLSVLKQKFWIN